MISNNLFPKLRHLENSSVHFILNLTTCYGTHTGCGVHNMCPAILVPQCWTRPPWHYRIPDTNHKPKPRAKPRTEKQDPVEFAAVASQSTTRVNPREGSHALMRCSVGSGHTRGGVPIVSGMPNWRKPERGFQPHLLCHVRSGLMGNPADYGICQMILLCMTWNALKIR